MADDSDIGFVRLPPRAKGEPKDATAEAKRGDDATGFTAIPRTKISAADRRAYSEALPGTPEGMKIREAIEKKYGGHEKFKQMFDPLGEKLGQTIPALALIGAAAGGGPATGAVLGAAGSAATSPMVRTLGTEALKWLGRGALGAAGYEAVRRATH